MPVLASEILSRVRKQLIDERATKRWEDSELLAWLSDGERTLVAIDPTRGEKTATVQLSAGTKQTVPDDGFLLLDVMRNMGTDGATPGRAIRVATREMLDNTDPNWHSGRRQSAIQNFVFDPKRPKVFYCWPPSTGEGHVEMSYGAVPPEITSVDQAITVHELYRTALFDYVMFRAHQKDSDYAAGEGKAGVYLQLFMAAAEANETGKLSVSPNLQLAAPDLSQKGTAS